MEHMKYEYNEFKVNSWRVKSSSQKLKNNISTKRSLVVQWTILTNVYIKNQKLNVNPSI